MKRFLVLLCTILPLAVCAQLQQWTQAEHRQRNYPSSEWYTGFDRRQLRAGEDVQVALRNLEASARNALSESIIVAVDATSRVLIESVQRQADGRRDEVETTGFEQAIQTATTSTLVRTEVRTHHDPRSGMIYAFVAVRRADLSRFYIRQINTDLNRVEIAIGAAEGMVEAGQRMAAERRIEEANNILSAVSFYRSLLIAVDSRACEEHDMQTPRFNELSRTIEQLLISLRRSTLVYVRSSFEFNGAQHDAFQRDPGIFPTVIKRALEQNNVTITANEADADFILTLVTSTSRRSERRADQPHSIDSFFANASGTLFNRRTNRQVATFSERVTAATGQTPELMATRAFNGTELKNAVLEAILPEIRN